MYQSRQAAVFIIPLFFLFLFCSPKKQRTIARSYYYWRSSGDISEEEKKFLHEHQINKLYVRLMDVDWSNTQGAIPVSTGRPDVVNQRLNQYDSLNVNVVPVVFITNKTFELIDSFDIPLLAKRIIRRCLPGYDAEDIRYEKNNPAWGLPLKPNEIQFDCDWTAKTRGKYFYFLNLITGLLPSDSIVVSATIRLHQYKYPDKTGIPPVIRGMLMVYNISDLRLYSPTNSIYDDKKAKAYFTQTKKYQLPLDIVLPAYSWCLIFRDQKFYQIENDLSENDLRKMSFLEKGNNGFYRVNEDTVYNDLFLRPGDEIKPEGIGIETLRQAAGLSRQAVNTNDFSVSFFELSESEIKNYSYESIEDIYHSFH